MQEIKDFLLRTMGDGLKQFFYEYWHYVVAFILVVIIIGMLLGSMKQLTWQMFTAAIRAGEAAFKLLFEKPKALFLGLIVAGIAVPSFMLGIKVAPEKVVEKSVTVNVPDLAEIRRLEAEIERLKGLIASTKGEQSGVANQAAEISSKLTTAQGEIASLNQRIADLNNEKAAVEGQLAPLLRPTKDRLDNIEAVKARIEEVRVAIEAEEAAWSDIYNTLLKTPKGELYDRLAMLRDKSAQSERALRGEKRELEVKVREIESEIRRIAAKLPAKEANPNAN